MEKEGEPDISHIPTEKYGLEEYIEYYQKGIYFIIDNWKGLYKNRVTGLSICFPFYDINIFFPLFAITILTSLGTTTEIFYKRTKDHISKHGRLDEIFFMIIMAHDKETPFVGYCQLQGMYLAAKEFGLEAEFFRLKKEHTKNIVPNF